MVLADGIYGTRDNRKYLQGDGISFGGKPLGRPMKQTTGNAEQIKLEKKLRRQDALERIPIEGKLARARTATDSTTSEPGPQRPPKPG